MFTNSVVAGRVESVHALRVFTKAELLRALDAKVEDDETNFTRIGEAIGLPGSRVSEIFRAIRDTDRKPRELTYDEGVRLIHAFELEPGPQASPLPPSILRLAVRHVARKLSAPAQDALIAELAEDLRAFSEYVSDPKVRQSVEAAEGFFQALQRRRPTPVEEARQETDHGSDPDSNR